MAVADASISRDQLFRTLLEDGPVACQVLDSDGRLLLVNGAWQSLTNLAPAEVLGRPFSELVATESRRQYEHSLQRLLQAGECPDLELRLAGRGRQPTVQLIWKPGPDGATAARQIFCILIDVSEQARLRRQLAQAQKMEAIGQLAGGIAHDFNNILSVIIGYADILRLKLPAGDPKHLDLDQILQASQRAAQLTSSLLTFSRRQLLNMTRIDLDRHLAATQKLLRRLIGEDIDFSVELACGRTLLADANQLDQVLINLVVNARDAMPTGGQLRISSRQIRVDDNAVAALGALTGGEYAVLEVSDTGSGMDEATAAQIFEPFFTTKEEGRGTGLGLATVYGIVKQHNGWIEVDSEPGKGSAFRIFLPTVPEAAETEQESRPADMTGGREKILLVEDEENLRTFASELLRRFGYSVLTADDGEKAMEIFCEHRKDIGLLILDLVLPKKYGYEVWREVSRLRPGIRVLFISGYPVDMNSLGATVPPGKGDFLAKPFSAQDLLAKIRDILDRG
ncbi:MAG: ATP-binding protein [Thermodesulfobacteriota bacterium]